MLYSSLVAIGGTFLLGLLLGGLIIGLWMRAKLARLEAAKQFADQAAAQLGETFRSLADAALRSNQSSFLDASRATLETARAQITGELSEKQTAIEGVVRPLSESLERLEERPRERQSTRLNSIQDRVS